MEAVLARTGFGMYNVLLLIFGSTCYLTNASAYMNMPLYLPMIACDLQLSESTISAVDFCMYIGMGVGGFFLCGVSDVVGRKAVIATSLLLIFLGVLVAAFAYGTLALSVAMIIFGSGLEANLNILKVLFVETIPKEHRFACVICLDICWVLGMLAALGFYWLTMPILLSFIHVNQRFLNWRISALTSVVLSIILSCITALFLESPKYLLFERRPRDALEVMREIYAINKSKLFTTFQFTDGELQGKITDFGISGQRDLPNTLSLRRMRIIFTRIHKSLLVLVRKKFLYCTVLAIIFRMVLSMGQLPMTILWARSLDLENRNLHSDRHLLWHFEHPVFLVCKQYQSEMNVNLYRDFAILCGCSMLGHVFLIGLVQCAERRGIMTCALFIGGIFSVLLGYIVHNYIMRFILSGMMAVAYSMACSCLDLLILDIFPTAVRNTAMGETMIFARLANVFVIKYMTAPIQWLFVGLGCLMELGAVLAFFLPKFANKVVAD